jgi:hypothetical protein
MIVPQNSELFPNQLLLPDWRTDTNPSTTSPQVQDKKKSDSDRSFPAEMPSALLRQSAN